MGEVRVPPASSAPPETTVERRGRLGALRDEARGCTRCPQLAAARTTVVFGSGDPDADVLLVGEAPGWNEDQQGLPLVGAAGRLLAELLADVGLRRDEVYVTTVLKCRPPSNRDALAEELANCRSWLERQVELVRPKVVCTLGTVPTKLLRGRPDGIKAARGRVEVVAIGDRAVRLLPLTHPVAALYQGRLADQLRTDLALLPGLIAQPDPPQPARPERVVPDGGGDPGREDGGDRGDAAGAGAPGPAASTDGDGATDAPGGQLGLFG